MDKKSYLNSVDFLNFAQNYSGTFLPYREDFKNSVLVSPTQTTRALNGDAIYADFVKGNVEITVVREDPSVYSDDFTVSAEEFESSFEIVGVEKNSLFPTQNVNLETIQKAYELFMQEKESPSVGFLPLDKIQLNEAYPFLKVTLNVDAEYCAKRYGFIPESAPSFGLNDKKEVMLIFNNMDMRFLDFSADKPFSEVEMQYFMDIVDYNNDKQYFSSLGFDGEEWAQEFPLFSVDEIKRELHIKNEVASPESVRRTFVEMANKNLFSQESKELAVSFYERNEDFILKEFKLRETPRLDKINASYKEECSKNHLSYDYVKEMVKNLAEELFEVGIIDAPLYQNMTDELGADSFTNIVLSYWKLEDFEKRTLEEVKECLEQMTSYDDSVRECIDAFLAQDVNNMFLNRDSAVLLSPDKRESLDFSKLGMADDSMFAVRKEENAFLYVENVFENTDDEIAFLLKSLDKVMELTYDMSVGMSVDINRVTQEMGARLNVLLDYQSNDSPYLSYPIALTPDEQDQLIAIVEAEIKEPVKVSEKDVKKNSFLSSTVLQKKENLDLGSSKMTDTAKNVSVSSRKEPER